MKGKKIDEMLHKIREEHSKELEGLTVEEEVHRANELAEKYAEELGLRTLKAEDRLTKPDRRR